MQGAGLSGAHPGRSQDQTGTQTEKLKKKSSSDVTSPLAEQADTALDQGSEERDYLIRTIVFEALGETEIGKAAVAYVILNRKRNGSWGDRIRDVVTYPRQFEPWITRKDEIEKLGLAEPLLPWLPPRIRDLVTEPQSDALDGSILMARRAFFRLDSVRLRAG